MSHDSGEYTAVIQELRSDISRAEKWTVAESKEFKEMQNIVSTLNRVRENLHENHQKELKHLIKDEHKAIHFENKLKAFVTRILKEIPYLERVVSDSRLEQARKTIKEYEEKLVFALKPGGQIEQLITTIDKKEQNIHILYRSIEHAEQDLNVIHNELEYLTNEFKRKKVIIEDYEQIGQAVAHDLWIAKKISSFFNAAFFNAHRYIDHRDLYHELVEFKHRKSLSGGYLAHHISQHLNVIAINLNKQESNDIIDYMNGLNRTNDAAEKFAFFFQASKKLPFSPEALFRIISDVIEAIYDKNKFTGFHVIPDRLYNLKVPDGSERKNIINKLLGSQGFVRLRIDEVLTRSYQIDHRLWHEAYQKAGLRLHENQLNTLGHEMIRITTIVLYDRIKHLS